MAEKMMRTEAKDWAIKYLILDSEEEGLILLIIMGIILIRLISNPNQQENQEEDEEAIRVPEIRVIKYNLFFKFNKI